MAKKIHKVEIEVDTKKLKEEVGKAIVDIKKAKESPSGFGTFDLNRAAEDIIKRHYKSPESARKIRKFLRLIDTEFIKYLENEPTPPHIALQQSINTIYSLNVTEITDLLMERNRMINSADPNRFSELLTDATTAKVGFMNFIRGDISRMRTVWDAGRFLQFGFESLSTKENWNWILKIAVHREMKKVHHGYDVRLVLSPEKHWREMEQIDDDIQDLNMNPQLALNIEGGEKAAKMEKIKAQREGLEIEWGKQQKACPDVVFDGKVRDVAYRDIKIWDDSDGESITIPGTVLTLKIPGRTVEELNAIRGSIKDYHIRLFPHKD